ncbi:hypothetical protein NQ318_000610 [Aromia moschata]|uniref:Uncharacterized protein n=1 Tax=Aromia moschata TaxID=1265417 RepID=A0AAV8XPJ9_9CUCU|nr:hypothetical protein NQ318_000610 [Aromia moschata]
MLPNKLVWGATGEGFTLRQLKHPLGHLYTIPSPSSIPFGSTPVGDAVSNHTLVHLGNPMYQESYSTTTQEGDLATGVKTVKFEKVTVKKTVRHITSSSSSTSIRQLATSSRTPSEELVLEDSAYLTQSSGNLASTSKTSSASSLTGKFPSEESLRDSPTKEQPGKDECDRDSNSSKVTSSSSEWYSEYRTHSFHMGSSRLDYVRSKSQYDEHIAHIRGLQFIYSFTSTLNSVTKYRVL